MDFYNFVLIGSAFTDDPRGSAALRVDLEKLSLPGRRLMTLSPPTVWNEKKKTTF